MRSRSLRLGQAFVDYASRRLPDSFWEQPWILRELIQIEVNERANPGNLPDVVLWYSKRDLG
jgi:hypothetical protein